MLEGIMGVDNTKRLRLRQLQAIRDRERDRHGSGGIYDFLCFVFIFHVPQYCNNIKFMQFYTAHTT